MSNLRKQWNDACLSAGINSLSTDTSARIMAVLLLHGNNEEFTHNTKFMADCEYIQKRYNIDGGEMVIKEISELLTKYVYELDDYEKANGVDAKPQWAIDLFKDMYGIKL